MTETLWQATIEPDVSSIPGLRQQVLPCFRTTAEGLSAMLACDEALTNIAMHSGATSVGITIRRDDRGICIQFSDDGIPFDPLAVSPTERDFEDFDQGGMGISLMKQACSDIAYEYTDSKNILTLLFFSPHS